MKAQPFLAILACGFFGGLLTLSAQNPGPGDPPVDAFSSGRPVEGNPREENPLYTPQDSGTLNSRGTTPVDRQTVVDVETLRQPSPYLKTTVRFVSTSEEELRQHLATLSATYAGVVGKSASADCEATALAVRQRIKLDPPAVLEAVEQEMEANPSCSCEIVKAAIQTTSDDPSGVIAIVAAAINVAPEQMRLISQCAIAASPESLAAVQELLAKLDPAGGDSGKSAKSSKDAVAAAAAPPEKPESANPLDRPPLDWNGGHIIVIPPVTNVNP